MTNIEVGELRYNTIQEAIERPFLVADSCSSGLASLEVDNPEGYHKMTIDFVEPIGHLFLGDRIGEISGAEYICSDRRSLYEIISDSDKLSSEINGILDREETSMTKRAI